MGNYCYVASAQRRARRWGAHGGRRGAGHIVSPRAQLVRCSIRLLLYVRDSGTCIMILYFLSYFIFLFLHSTLCSSLFINNNNRPALIISAFKSHLRGIDGIRCSPYSPGHVTLFYVCWTHSLSNNNDNELKGKGKCDLKAVLLLLEQIKGQGRMAGKSKLPKCLSV